MNSPLQRLTRLAPPPLHPVAPGSPIEWQRIEADLGVRLPEDYKELISVYGAGHWANFFGVIDPFYRWKHPQAQKTWQEWRHLRLASLEEFRKEFPEFTAPFRTFPAPDGLLAFGYDDNGGTLCWQTKGDPQAWRLVLLDGKLSEDYDSFEMTLTAFLAAIINEEILPRTWPADLFPIEKPAFRPYTTE